MITSLRKKLGNKSKKSGFTLIELIIVIAIIAILVMIALPKFAQVKENANVKSDMANGKEIQTAVIALINDDKITSLNTGKVALSDAGADATAIRNYMQDPNVKAKSKNVKKTEFYYAISDVGDVKIYAGAKGDTEVFPDSSGLTE